MKESHCEGVESPFYDDTEQHQLVGVANVYLETLQHPVKLAYHVPIISQQAEVAGRLLVGRGGLKLPTLNIKGRLSLEYI